MCLCFFFSLISCICCCHVVLFFFFKQKTAYEMRISDWSSDVCSSDLSDLVIGKREIDRRRRVIELGDDRGSFAAQGMALRSGTSLRFHRLPTTGTLVSVEIYRTTIS